MTYANPDWCILPEATLRQLLLGAGEAAAEAEDNETRQECYRQIKVLNAIGELRFPDTWGDGISEENPREDREYQRQCCEDAQAEYDSQWPIYEMPIP